MFNPKIIKIEVISDSRVNVTIKTVLGETKQMEINAGRECLMLGLDRWDNGELIQNALSDLSADEREFIQSGTTPEEWAEMFAEEE